MGKIADRLTERGLTVPPEPKLPPGVVLPFEFVHVVGARAFVAGHGPQGPDGAVVGPFGQVGVDVTVDEAIESARLTALSMLGSLQRTLGDLDRITAWGRVFGMVCCAPGFDRQPAVVNGFSDLVLDVFGPHVGAHSRSAVGMAALPFGIPVEIEAEVMLRASPSC